jgi:hypothetical protein
MKKEVVRRKALSVAAHEDAYSLGPPGRRSGAYPFEGIVGPLAALFCLRWATEDLPSRGRAGVSNDHPKRLLRVALSRPGEELRQNHRTRGPFDFLAMLNENETLSFTNIKVRSKIERRLGVCLCEGDAARAR